MIWLKAVGVGVALAAAPAMAQDAGALLRCPGMKADADRLACYDAAMKPKIQPTTSTGRYQSMDLIDFKTDASELSGKRVEVSGYIMAFAGQALLTTKPGDMNSVPIEVEGLSREERRRLLSCSSFCRATVQGVGASVLNQNGIRAEALTVR